MATSKGKSYKVIAPDRFLTTRALNGAVTVLLGDQVIAMSRKAIFLEEGERAPVPYLDKSEITAAALVRSSSQYHCRWKGDAVYFNIELDDSTIADGAWAYPEAPDDLEVLHTRVAFDASVFQIKVAEIETGQPVGRATESMTE